MNSRVQAGSLRASDVGQNVTVAGWVRKQRDLGELIFIDLRDRSGILQLVADEARTAKKVLAVAKSARAEFVVRATGLIVEREADRKNSEMGTGEIELLVQDFEIISKAETPPFVIDDETTATEETRLRHRYLDLRRPSLTRNMMLRDQVSAKARQFLHESGFLEVETPILTASTPEGARDYLVPSRVHEGEFYALPQSPQLFKQLLMVSGLERYYQIAKCFRDEDLRSDRQPEFTQIDIEASFIDEEFIYEMIEKLFVKVFPVAGINPVTPFPRLTWRESMEKYGTDRPDLRYGMEIEDVTASMATSEFPPFREAVGKGERIKAIAVPRGGGFSRKKLDGLTEAAKQAGASGLIWVSFGENRKSSIKKFLADSDYEKIRELVSAGSDDLVLMVAGEWEKASTVLGDLRTRIAREEALVRDSDYRFCWITDFPLLERDEEAGRWVARHHPFTSPKPDQMSKLESDPGSVTARAYDVVLNGLELGGGSIRIHDSEIQTKMFEALGIGEEEARERFGFLLDAFRYGAPPHGGIALGLDRMVMLMAGATSIRDVIAFPKTTSGQDLMTGAPSGVDKRQLEELSISIKRKK